MLATRTVISVAVLSTFYPFIAATLVPFLNVIYNARALYLDDIPDVQRELPKDSLPYFLVESLPKSVTAPQQQKVTELLGIIAV